MDSLGSGSGEVVGEAVGLLVGLGFLPLPPESAGALADSLGFASGSSVGEAAGLAGCEAEGESVGSGVLADA